MPTTNEKIRDALLRYAHFVETLTDRQLRQLEKVLMESVNDINDQITRMGLAGTNLNVWERTRLLTLREEIEKVLAATTSRMSDQIEDNFRQIAFTATDEVNNILRASIPKDLIVVFNAVPLAQVIEFIDAPTGGLLWRDRMIQRYRDLLTPMDNIISRGIMQGWSVPQMVKEFKTLVGNEWKKGSWEQIIRTEVVRIGNAVNLATYKQNNDIIKGVQWLATLDAKTCQICAALDSKFWPLGEFDLYCPAHPRCYKEGTEIYTNNGWKDFREVKNDDLILSLNPETHEIEFVPFVKKISYHYDGNLIKFSNKWFDLEITPNHSMLIGKRSDPKDRKKKTWRFQEAKDLCGEYFILRTGKWNKKSPPTIIIGNLSFNPNDFAYFMGWWLSEGYIVTTRPPVIGITQSSKKLNDIYQRVKKIFEPYSNVYKTVDRVEFRNKDLYDYLKQFGKSCNKFIPNEIKNLSKEDIRIFLESFILGDGSTKQGYWKDKQLLSISKVAHTSSKKLCDDLSELILKVGGYPSIKFVENKGKSIKFKNGIYKLNTNMYVISWNKTQTAYSNRLNVDEIKYSGFVHCLELSKNHIMWVKYNNKTCFSGNCRCILTPVTKSWRELGFDVDELAPGTRASMNGQVPSTMKYSEWFGTQSAFFQRNWLGNKRYELWKNGKLEFEDFLDSKKLLKQPK